MGVITISIDDESEKLLRESAKLHFGERKDALSKTIIKALNNLKNSRDILKEDMIIKLNDKSIKLNNKIKDRSDYYKK
jgi:hypothetical protein